MTARLRDAAAAAGDKLPRRENLIVMVHRWENGRSGMSERYRLHFCRAFGIPPGCFGEPDAASAPGRNGTGDSPAGDQAMFPVRIPLVGDELRETVDRLRDPENKDELCFLLGYLSATMAAARLGHPAVGLVAALGVADLAEPRQRMDAAGREDTVGRQQ